MKVKGTAVTLDDNTLSTNSKSKMTVTKTLDSRVLKRAQQLHAIIAAFLTTIGLVSAIFLAVYGDPFNWIDMGIFISCFVIIGTGSAIGYHRLFTHRSFKATPGVRKVFAILGSMTMQGSVIFWVALHRRHHTLSDQEGDPHSPHLHGKGFWNSACGLWHSYMGWTFSHEVPNAIFYAKDLLKDSDIVRINQQYFYWAALGLIIPTVLGGVLHGTLMGAISGLIWGGLFRLYLWHNMTWAITSIAHVIGTRDFKSNDKSTNNFWLAIPTLGESWHNNHHAFPSSAYAGLKWWQIDICGYIILALETLDLVSQVGRPSQKMMLEKAIP